MIMRSHFEYRKPEPVFMNLSAEPNYRDLSLFVESFMTNKTLGMSAGTFEINLVPHPDPRSEEENIFPAGITKDNFESFIYKSVRPMDAVVIGMKTVTDNYVAKGSTGVYGTEEIMFGFVDGVFKSKVTQGRNVRRGITIRGRDATKMFINDNVAYAPELATDPDVIEAFGDDVKRLQFLNYIRGLSEDDDGIVKVVNNVFMNKHIPIPVYWILRHIPAMRLNIDYFGDGQKKPHEIFRTSLTCRREDKLFDANMNMYAGTVANYFNQIIDPDFHEIWVDTVPASSPLSDDNIARPVFMLRPKPFDFRYEIDTRGNNLDFDGLIYDPDTDSLKRHALTHWDNLTSPITGEETEITEDKITYKAVGIADYEVATQYKIFGQQDVLAASQVGRFGWYLPLLDVNMFKLFGIRELTSQSRLLPYVSDWVIHLPGSLDKEDTEAGNNIGDADGAVDDDSTVIDSVDDAIESVDHTGGGKKSGLEFLTVERRDRIWRWNRYNHILESGQLTFAGRNVHVGSKIKLPDEPTRGIVIDEKDAGERIRYQNADGGMEYYCEGVRHQYRFGTPWLTTLRLTRGHNPAELAYYHDIRKFGRVPGKANNIFVSNRYLP